MPSIPLGNKKNLKITNKIIGLDICKCYTSIFMNLKKIIKYDFFELVKIYDNHEINDDYLYTI